MSVVFGFVVGFIFGDVDINFDIDSSRNNININICIYNNNVNNNDVVIFVTNRSTTVIGCCVDDVSRRGACFAAHAETADT